MPSAWPERGTLVATDGRVVCARCEVAAGFAARSKGLLGRSGLAEGEGLLITKTSSIHTFFMRFVMDAVFLDRELRVRAVVPAMRPFRMAWKPGSNCVLELAGGEAARVGIEVGEQFSWHDQSDA